MVEKLRTLGLVNVFLLTVILAPKLSVHGQALPTRPPDSRTNLRTQFEYDVLNQIIGRDGISRQICQVRNTLSRQGDFALINDPLREKTILVDVEASKYTELDLKNPVCAVWFDSESDCVYSGSLEVKADFSSSHSFNALAQMPIVSCYASLDDLKNGNAMWRSSNLQSTVWKIPGTQNRIKCLTDADKNSEVTIENDNGKEISSRRIPGFVVGVDSEEENVLIFHVTGNHVKSSLRCSVIGGEGRKGSKTKVIAQDFPAGTAYRTRANSFEINDKICGSRHFRLRELKPGDVKLYMANLASRPGFWELSDYVPSVQVLLKHNVHNYFSRQWGRISSLNCSASALAPEQYEIFTSLGSDHNAFLANHQGEFVQTPLSCIDDAILDETKSILLGYKRGTVCIMKLERATSDPTPYGLNRR